jgi:hypothetical protein
MVRERAFEAVRDTALWFSPTWHRHVAAVHQRNAALAATICEMAQARIVVDSSKIGLRLKYLLRNPELDVKVIRLIRDGRAVALTYMDPARFADARDPGKRAGGMGGDRAKDRVSMARAAHTWQRSMQESEHLLATLDPSRWMEVRYEDYCANPDVVLSSVHRFLGVDPGNQPRDFRAVEQHVVGNGMRLDTTSRVSLDDRWKDALTEEDLRVFDEVSGQVNRRHGYA